MLKNIPFQKIFSGTLISFGLVFSLIGLALSYAQYETGSYQPYEQVCEQEALALKKENDVELLGACVDGHIHAWLGFGLMGIISLGIGLPSLVIGFIWRLFLRRKHQ